MSDTQRPLQCGECRLARPPRALVCQVMGYEVNPLSDCGAPSWAMAEVRIAFDGELARRKAAAEREEKPPTLARLAALTEDWQAWVVGPEAVYVPAEHGLDAPGWYTYQCVFVNPPYAILAHRTYTRGSTTYRELGRFADRIEAAEVIQRDLEARGVGA